MKEQLVSKKTAILAKEKGFNEETYLFFNSFYPNGIQNINGLTNYMTNLCKEKVQRDDFVSLPTQSLLQRWLREKHKIYVESKVGQRGSRNHRLQTYFSCEVSYRRELEFEDKCGMGHIAMRTFSTYEEAIEEALYEALDRLDELTYKNSTKRQAV